MHEGSGSFAYTFCGLIGPRPKVEVAFQQLLEQNATAIARVEARVEIMQKALRPVLHSGTI